MGKKFFQCHQLADIPTEIHHGSVVAIGNFDGVHQGHQSVLQQALALAQRNNLPALVLTFEPHPRTFFNPSKPVDRLTPAQAKAEIFQTLNFDGVVSLDFDQSLSSLTAQDFIDKILMDGLGAKHVVTGENFYFGSQRSGNPQFLAQAGGRFGFETHIIKAVQDETGGLISSSRIRQLLAEGAVQAAADLLCHHYRICAKVVQGNQLGRTLGFPTANMQVPTETKLKTGIYAVRLRRSNGRLHDGVASFGFRPTVNEVTEPLLETFIFDFDADLYGESCSVSFFAHLRGEEKFDSLEMMIAQMHRDTQRARTLLQASVPLSPLDACLNFPARDR